MAIPIKLAITNSVGDNVFNHTKIRFVRDKASPLLEKRTSFGAAYSSNRDQLRVIDQCPSDPYYDYYFAASECVPERSLQAYEVNCTQIPPTYGQERTLRKISGECAEDEICYDNVIFIGAQASDFAICMHEDLVSDSSSDEDPAQQPVEDIPDIDLGLANEEEGVQGIEVLLQAAEMVDSCLSSSEGSCGTNGIRAESMQIAAQSVNEIFGARSYSTLDGGLSSCTSCSSLALRPIPSRTQYFRLTIDLPPRLNAPPDLYIKFT